MAYNFRLGDISDDSFLKNKKTGKVVFPHNLGEINTSKEVISEDISMLRGNLKSNGELSLTTDFITDEPKMFIGINLNGNFYRYNYITNVEEDYCQNTILIEYRDRVHKLFKMNKDASVNGLEITIENSFLEENFFNHLKDEKRRELEENCKNSIPVIFKSSKVSRKTFALVKDIYSSPFSGALHNIYFQSKVYEIIYNELLSVIDIKDKREPKRKIALSQDDIDALKRAKRIILEDKRNFSINEIAKRVAINENKLKYGFKKLFNTSPGNMILETKMHEAKRLLEESDYNINEVAEIIGYKYAQNFTKAFIDFFGKKPSDIMKSRRYYY